MQKKHPQSALPWPYDEALDPRSSARTRDQARQIPHGIHAAAGARGRMDAQRARGCLLQGPGGEGHPHLRGERASGLVLGVATDMSVGRRYGRRLHPGVLLGQRGEAGLRRFPDPPDEVDIGTMNTLVTGDMLEKRLGYREHKAGPCRTCAHPHGVQAITGEPRGAVARQQACDDRQRGLVRDHRQDGDDIPVLYMYPAPPSPSKRAITLRRSGWRTIYRPREQDHHPPRHETVNEEVVRSRIVSPSWAIRSLRRPSTRNTWQHWAPIWCTGAAREMMKLVLGSLPMSWDDWPRTWAALTRWISLHLQAHRSEDGQGEGWNRVGKN